MVAQTGNRPSFTHRRRSVREQLRAASSSRGVRPMVTGNSLIARSAADESLFKS